MAGRENSLLTQFYLAGTNFPAEPHSSRQQGCFRFPAIGEDPSAIKEWQRDQRIPKYAVLEMNQGKNTHHSLCRKLLVSTRDRSHHFALNRHQVIGGVSIGLVNYVAPAEQVEEAGIGTFLDISVPRFPIRVSRVLDLVCS